MTLIRFDWQGAWNDLAGALSRRWLWTGLARHDLRLRYRGTVLGPFWMTLNIALLVAALSVVFGRQLGGGPDYPAWLACGLVLWQFLQTTLSEACQLFVASAETVRNVPMPISVHVLRLVYRNAIVLAHNLLVIVAVLVVFGPRPGSEALAALPGLVLLVVVAAAAALLLAVIGARFRDLTQIVTNALQLLFFLTPILWRPAGGTGAEFWFARLNPIVPLIDAVRAPLLGGRAAGPFAAATAVAGVAILLAFAALAAGRRHVPYWI